VLPVMIGMFVRASLFKASDWVWVRKFGGMLSDEHVPADKVNAGQKMMFWGMVVILSSVLAVTGLILDFPNFNQTRQTMQISHLIHMGAAMLALVTLSLHVYLGTIGVRGSYRSMRYGYVDEDWAREHHEYWYNDVVTGRAPRGQPPAQPLPHERPVEA
jgi:formate dehydrogenase subunit gamma